MPLLNKDKKEEIKKAIASGDTSKIKEVKKTEPLVESGPLPKGNQNPAKLPSTNTYAAPTAEQKKEAGEQLISAADMGDLDMVKDMLSDGADINYQDNRGETALMCASMQSNEDVPMRRNKTEVLRYLISQNADLDKKDNAGMSALDHAEEGLCMNVVDILKMAGAK